MALLWYGIPICAGLAFGYIFAWPVNLTLGVIAAVIGGGLLWSTRNAELGALIGMIAALEAALFIVPLAAMTLLMNGAAFNIDLSWVLR